MPEPVEITCVNFYFAVELVRDRERFGSRRRRLSRLDVGHEHAIACPASIERLCALSMHAQSASSTISAGSRSAIATSSVR